jgi:hypothetical protein
MKEAAAGRTDFTAATLSTIRPVFVSLIAARATVGFFSRRPFLA